MRTLADFGFNGLDALRWTVTAPNGYPRLEQAVASLAVFVSPDTLAQTKGNIFQMARGGRRRQFDNPDRPTIMWDDNAGPHCALKGAGLPTAVKGQHLQLNHLYGKRVEFFTDLRSICVTPTFLGSTTEDQQPVAGLLRLLKRRAFELYEFAPEGEPAAEGYGDLEWAPTLPAIPDLQSVLSNRLRNTRGHIATAVRRFGWHYNGFAGDPWASPASM
jgi:hypothetical protein